MHRVIAKYGLAAHLSFLAVAPLFLYPFCTASATATAVLWLSLVAAIWCLLVPSVRSGEPLHVARRRVLSDLVRDPLFWTSLALAAFTGLRALNGGVRMAYDAEKAVWCLEPPALPIFPGCMDGLGYLPFAVAVALVVVLVGARHSLGRSARMAFLLMASAGAGLAAVVALVAANQGNVVCRMLLVASPDAASYFGFAQGVYFLCGLVVLTTAFERAWVRAMPLFALAVGGTAVGVFAFAPGAASVLFLALALVVLLAAFVYLFFTVGRTSQFRYVAVLGIALALAALTVAFAMPAGLLQKKLDVFLGLAFVPDGFFDLRGTLSEIALRAWKTAPWTGTGIGSFPLDVRFQATPDDWAVLPRGVSTIANGGWCLLAERGLVGAVAAALPFGFIAWSFVRRAAAWATGGRLRVPHPGVLLAPLVLVAIAVTVPFDNSFLRPDALLAAAAAAAVAPKCFPSIEKRSKHG